ncbi:MAG: RNA-binding protein [Algoriphagus sp. 32-45-6]|nr:MAG: RNA-binding protein [Algoriphagus sp. 32-45-6]
MAQDPSLSRKKEAAPLEAAFKELLKAYRLEDKYQEKLLIASWSQLVGQTIASRTESVYIKDKKLFVKVSSGPIKKELQMNRSKVMALIDEKIGKGVVNELIVV